MHRSGEVTNEGSTRFGDVGVGGDKSSSYGSFRFSVSSSATAHSVPFKVALADQDGNTWSSSFQLQVQ